MLSGVETQIPGKIIEIKLILLCVWVSTSLIHYYSMQIPFFKIFCQITPDAIKLRRKQRKTEHEVAELQQKLASTAKSIVLSNREIRLLR